MLATRRLPLAAVSYVRYAHPAYGVWSPRVKTLPMLQATTTTLKWNTKTSLVAAYSKDTKVPETPLNSSNPSLTSTPPPANLSASSSSSATVSKSCSSPPSPSNTTESVKTQTNDCSTATIGGAGVKLPSRDQVENFAFKSLVYFWDFLYYVFCMCRKLFQTYVVSNSTVQHNWKQLLKRMDDARNELKRTK